MVSGELVKYVQEYHSKGYSLATLRDFLINQGYAEEDVNSAIHSAYSLEHIPKSRLFIIISIMATIIILASFFFMASSYFAEETEVISLKTYASAEEAHKGGPFSFKVVLDNIGSKKDFPVAVHYELIKGGVVELSGDEKTSSERGEIIYTIVPKHLGEYTVKTTVSYGEFVNEDFFTFSALPLCGDKVCDENEVCTADCAGELCGDGVCSAGEQCEKDCVVKCGDGVCSSGESCAEDCPVCGDGVCGKNEECASDCLNRLCGNGACDEGETYLNCIDDCEVPKTACGNNICEQSESTKSCPADCRYDTGINSMSAAQVRIYVPQKLLEIGDKETAKECLSAVEQVIKDECFKALSKAMNASAYCNYINTAGLKDECIITYVYKTNDYEKCGEITDDFVRKNCEYLKNYNQAYTAPKPLQ
jgi:hypothetical protein